MIAYKKSKHIVHIQITQARILIIVCEICLLYGPIKYLLTGLNCLSVRIIFYSYQVINETNILQYPHHT